MTRFVAAVILALACVAALAQNATDGGAFGSATARGSLTFVSGAAYNAGVKERFGLAKNVSAVKDIRQVRKQHLIHNGYVPKMEIDPQTYAVRADGQLLTCEPATELPMAQRYFLF